MRLREDLAEVRHPLAENSVAALQLFNAPWRRPWLRRRGRLPLPPRVCGAFGYLGGLAEGAAALAPTAGEVAGTLAGTAGVGAAATAGLAAGIAGGAAYGLARGTGWVLENTLFRPQQGSEDAAVQDVRSANNMNDATQPQHFTLRTGSSTSGQPRKQPRLLAVRLPRPGAVQQHAAPLLLGPEPRGPAPVPELAGELQFRAVTPEPASAQL